MINTSTSNTRSLWMRFLALHYCLVAAMCLVSAFSGSRSASPITTSAASPTYTGNNGGAFRRPLVHTRRSERKKADVVFKAAKEEFDDDDDDDDTNDEDDGLVSSSRTTSGDASTSTGVAVADPGDAPDESTSASRWNRRKQIAQGLVASIATTAFAAKAGVLDFGGGAYTDSMIARDAFMTGLTSVLAVAMNRAITWGYENGKYDSKTGRKITHILSAPLFVVTWPFFSEASGARIFAGLVTLTNGYRLYLAGTGDAAESSLANTISRSGDKSEVLGGPFIYVCLFQCFILAFWRDTFPGVVAMTTMAAGDGMADIIGRRYGRNGYKWPFSDGEKSLVGTVAFAVFASGLTLAICSWLIATGALTSSLEVSELVLRIFAISCICSVVEILPIGDDNYTVPGSAALLSWLWLR